MSYDLVLEILAILCVIVFSIVRAYENYWRRVEYSNNPAVAYLKYKANAKWHRYQASHHVLFAVCFLLSVDWWFPFSALFIIWTVFDFVYSLLTFRTKTDNRALWEFGTTSVLDRIQDKIFSGNKKAAFVVKLIISSALIALHVIY